MTKKLIAMLLLSVGSFTFGLMFKFENSLEKFGVMLTCAIILHGLMITARKTRMSNEPYKYTTSTFKIKRCPNGHGTVAYQLMRCNDDNVFEASGYQVSCGHVDCPWLDDGPVRKTKSGAIKAWNKEVK